VCSEERFHAKRGGRVVGLREREGNCFAERGREERFRVSVYEKC